ncbi:ABC transporter ATP-binding protein [Rhizobium sp. L80/93]|uniref:ABC transporter ATP-binding protein n=1 Tax=Rhizobium sp. E27B/91 TaxID=2819995 RepID=UPI001AD96BC4|nr:ABC transporter ATP-binding protein [Rhizobium sp. E27B/91]MBO9186760.1 ABC transporter ATP-binding protein [Rhizobium sp. E27B/91]
MSDYLSIEGIGKRYGMATALEAIDIGVSRGEFLALLGPSGCGKTTLLRIIAGLLNADGGKIVLDGLYITDLPPWKRDIGLVFQNYALFPHMSVRENVGFGLQMRKIDARAIVPLVDEALDVVRLRDYAERRPSELSGGQQQRVAIARAIAIKPRLLLLDEPLSNLDAVLRNSVRVELRELHERTGLTTIMVTHDQAEALTLADRIAVLSQGSVLQHDTAEVIYEQPQTAFVAAFVGSPPASLFLVRKSLTGEILLDGDIVWSPPSGVGAALGTFNRRALHLALRPESLTLVPRDTRHSLPGTLRTVEYMGSDRLAHVAIGDQTVLVRTTGTMTFTGPDIGVLMPDAMPPVFDPETGFRLHTNPMSEIS